MCPNHNSQLKTLGPQSVCLVSTLYEENKPVFRLEDVRRILNLQELPASSFVRQLVNRGVATRLKPGLFILVPQELGREREYMGSPLIVARELARGKGYYLSHGTAMELHGMVTQPQLVVHVTTMKKRRPVHIMGTDFQFITCKKEHFFGISKQFTRSDVHTIQIALLVDEDPQRNDVNVILFDLFWRQITAAVSKDFHDCAPRIKMIVYSK